MSEIVLRVLVIGRLEAAHVVVSRVALFYPDRAAASRSNAGVYLRMRHQQAKEQKAATATENARQHPLLLEI